MAARYGHLINKWTVAAVAALALMAAVLATALPVWGQGTDGIPVIEEAPATMTHEENDGDAVYHFRARDPEGKPIFWTLSGTDAPDFTIDDGMLMFKSAPDYEMPTDRANTNVTPNTTADDNVYHITVRFSDGGAPAGEHPMTVTVTNMEETGMVMISPMLPQEGSELTATVIDPDDSISAEYKWSKSDTMDGTYTDIDAAYHADNATYTPTAADVGSYLRVMAQYVDGFGRSQDPDQIDDVMATATMPVRADTTANEAPVIPDQDISNATTDQAADTTPTRFVLENMPPGTPVGPPVTAVDDNLDYLTYAFGGTEAQMTAAEPFDIDPATAQITTNRVLDTEATATYAVVVTATDPDGEVVTTSEITITVSNVDEAPVFRTATSATPGAFNVEFNVVERTTVLYIGTDPATPADAATYTFTADDPEGVTTIIWSVEGDESEGFSISNDAGTLGQLSVPSLDYVRNGDNVYEVTIVAADSQYDDAKKAELLVTVKVTDDDETQQSGEITIFNLQPEVGTNLFLDGPVDDDDGGVRSVTWQWYSNDAACPAAGTDGATLDPDIPGVTTDWAKIDGATGNNYTPTIDDHTGADGNATATCLMVRASYLDDGPPGVDDISSTGHDESRQYAYAISANQVQAEDDNNLKPMFDDGDDSTQGIQTRARIAENDATDPLVVVSAITPAATAATTTSGAIPLTIGVAEDENVASGTFDTLTYTLDGPDAGDFTINKATGQVTMNSSPDYEDKNAYTFVVIATDPTNAKSDQDPRLTNGITVLVEVTNVNENPDAPDGPERIVYTENGMGQVASYTASDPEGDPFTWALTGTDAADFEISQLNGGLSFQESPDFEDAQDGDTNNIYEIGVGIVLTGETTPDATRTTTVMVKVVDEPEAPEFSSETATLDIDENRYPDMMLNRVVTGSPQAYDDDANRVVSLHYEISGAGTGAFGIVPATGELRTAQVLDFESLADPSYEVTVTATDPTGLSDSINVTINVNNVDEPPVAGVPNMAPEFPSATMTREIAENTAAGMAIGDPVMATDPENGGITYSLGGADAGHFTIDAMTGQLMTSGALDYESQSSYTVTVTAMDDDEREPMSGMTTVTINVTNEDDAGTVTVRGTPMVRVEQTASLSDPDGGVTGESWQWAKSKDMQTWMDISGATSMSYTPVDADVGYYLRAGVSYTDAHGPNKTAGAVSRSMVAEAAPPDPNAALVARYDTNGNGMIEKSEVIAAINDYLFEGTLTKAEVITLINLYLFG